MIHLAPLPAPSARRSPGCLPRSPVFLSVRRPFLISGLDLSLTHRRTVAKSAAAETEKTKLEV